MAFDLRNRTAVVIASGPSLTRDDCFDVGLSPAMVIAVNCSFRMAPWADVVYMGDMMAVKTYTTEARRLCPNAEFWSTCSVEGHGKWHRVKGSTEPGLGSNGAIALGGNSGYQAVCLAALFGAKRIALLGFDMHAGADGAKHWHPDHPAPCVQYQPFAEWIHKFESLAKSAKAADIDIVNCSRATALTCFRRGELLQELR